MWLAAVELKPTLERQAPECSSVVPHLYVMASKGVRSVNLNQEGND
jgi:hypothetical protein